MLEISYKKYLNHSLQSRITAHHSDHPRCPLITHPLPKSPPCPPDYPHTPLIACSAPYQLLHPWITTCSPNQSDSSGGMRGSSTSLLSPGLSAACATPHARTQPLPSFAAEGGQEGGDRDFLGSCGAWIQACGGNMGYAEPDSRQRGGTLLLHCCYCHCSQANRSGTGW